jgi:hypothetical protein
MRERETERGSDDPRAVQNHTHVPEGLGFRVRVSGLEFRVSGLGFRV